MKLNQESLKNIKKIIFDLDGVITNENAYFITARLTLKQILPQINSLPAKQILPLEHIKKFKQIAINSNWDITYIFYNLYCVNIENPPIDEFLEHLAQKNITGRAVLNELESFLKTKPPLNWEGVYEVFQTLHQKYLQGEGGSEYKGVGEILHSIAELQEFLKSLKQAGYILGTATGRPKSEALFALKQADCLKYFDEERLITYQEIEEAEQAIEGKTKLGKPHPFSVLRAIYNDVDIKEFSKPYEGISSKYLSNSDVLFIGDTKSDELAAKRAGVKFLLCVNH